MTIWCLFVLGAGLSGSEDELKELSPVQLVVVFLVAAGILAFTVFCYYTFVSFYAAPQKED